MSRSEPVGGSASFWGGRLASSLANVISSVAIPYLLAIVLNLPPAAVGLILSVQVLGFFLAPFVSGYLVDTRDRRRTMQLAELLRAASLAAMAASAFTGFGVEFVVAAGSFIASLAGSIYFAALSAAMPDIAGDERLPRANARLQGINTATESVGGIAGAGILALVGAPLAFGLNALLFLLSSVGLRRADWDSDARPPQPERRRYWTTLRDGFSLLRDKPEFRGLIVTGSLANFVIAGSTLPLLILLVEDRSFPFFAYTIVLGIGSAGAMLAATLFRRISDWIGSARRAQVISLALYAVGFAIYAMLGHFAIVTFVLAAFADFIIGVAVSVYVINNATQQQRAIPREMRGRSSSLRAFANSGMSAIGISVSGVAVGLLTANLVIWIAAAAMLVVAGFAALLLPRPPLSTDVVETPPDQKRRRG